MNVIGFANQYYTLWDCYTEVTNGRNGIRYIKEHNQYIKNISKDWNKVQKKYPGLQLDESLKGQTRSWTRNNVIYPEDVFRFGRYVGEKFTDVHDYDYMAWYFTQTVGEAQEALKPILEANGYHVFTYGDGSYGIMTQESWNEQLELERNREEARKILNEAFEDGSLVIFMDSNPNESGAWYDKHSGVTFYFDEVRELSYQGFPYYLPVLNGKAKRVKNKSIRILDGAFEGETFRIHNFEVKK